VRRIHAFSRNQELLRGRTARKKVYRLWFTTITRLENFCILGMSFKKSCSFFSFFFQSRFIGTEKSSKGAQDFEKIPKWVNVP